MLVLSRQKSEEIVVTLPDGRRGVISVAEIRADKVRLGIDFPKDVGINRREVQDVIDREQKRSEFRCLPEDTKETIDGATPQ